MHSRITIDWVQNVGIFPVRQLWPVCIMPSVGMFSQRNLHKHPFTKQDISQGITQSHRDGQDSNTSSPKQSHWQLHLIPLSSVSVYSRIQPFNAVESLKNVTWEKLHFKPCLILIYISSWTTPHLILSYGLSESTPRLAWQQTTKSMTISKALYYWRPSLLPWTTLVSLSEPYVLKKTLRGKLGLGLLLLWLPSHHNKRSDHRQIQWHRPRCNVRTPTLRRDGSNSNNAWPCPSWEPEALTEAFEVLRGLQANMAARSLEDAASSPNRLFGK